MIIFIYYILYHYLQVRFELNAYRILPPAVSFPVTFLAFPNQPQYEYRVALTNFVMSAVV